MISSGWAIVKNFQLIQHFILLKNVLESSCFLYSQQNAFQ